MYGRGYRRAKKKCIPIGSQFSHMIMMMKKATTGRGRWRHQATTIKGYVASNTQHAARSTRTQQFKSTTPAWYSPPFLLSIQVHTITITLV